MASEILSRFNDTCDLYELHPGKLSGIDGGYNFSKASIYLTNCTGIDLKVIQNYYNTQYNNFTTEVIENVLDPFSRSAIMADYATCAVAVSSWILFFMQALAQSRKPMLLMISTALLASTNTYFLVQIGRLTESQYDQCYQDSYEMIRLVSDSMTISAVYYVAQLSIWATCISCVHSVVTKLRQPLAAAGGRNNKTRWQSALMSSLIAYDISVIICMVLAGLMHFHAVPFESYDVTYWANILQICVTCFAYLYMFAVFIMFIMTRASFSFRFQSIVLIGLILGFLILAIAFNMIWLLDVDSNAKWFISVYLLFQLLSTNLVYELLANWKLFDRRSEHERVVGREILANDSDGLTAIFTLLCNKYPTLAQKLGLKINNQNDS